MRSVDLDGEQRRLWQQVEQLWELTRESSTAAPDLTAMRQAIHPAYRGWVDGRQATHDRDAAVRSIADAPPVHDYTLEPLGVTVYEGRTGVAHYAYTAQVRDRDTGSLATVRGRWTEVYVKRNGRWLLASVSGGPDGAGP